MIELERTTSFLLLHLVLIVAVGYTLYKLRKKIKYRSSLAPYPPSPPAHWLFGHALQLPNPLNGVHIDIFLLEWAKEFGKVFSLTVPIVGRLIVVSDPDFARHILVSKNYRKSPTYAKYTPVIGVQSILIADDKDWSHMRRVFNPGFAPNFLRRVVSVVVEKCFRMLNKCEADAKLSIETHLHQRVTDFTSDVIAQVAFGEDWGFDVGGKVSNETQLCLTELILEVVSTQRSPLRRYFGRKKREELKMKLDKNMSEVVKRRIKKGTVEDSQSKDILSLAINNLQGEENDEGAINIDTIVDQLKTFYFAGHDTTSTLVSWTIWLVAQHPDVCDKIRKEVAAELGQFSLQRPSVRKEQVTGEDTDSLTYEKLQCCTYLDAVLNEALRLYPPAATARYCDDPNAEYGGYRIGQCILYINCYIMHRHPDLWDEPDSFRPERFLDRTKKYDAFMPFSKGARDCIGKYFAIFEAKVAVAALLLNFDVKAVDTNEQVSGRITARPKNGARVHFSFRQEC